METVRVRMDEQFADRQFYKEDPMRTDKIAFSIYDFEPWQALPMRRHPRNDTVFYIVEGEGLMFIDDDAFSIAPDEAVYVPAGSAYGVLSGENDMVIIASQGPKPVETQDVKGMEFRCPACDLVSPVTRDTESGDVILCPRCESRLKLEKEAERFKAGQVSGPEFIEAEAPEGAAEEWATGPEVAGSEPTGQELAEKAEDIEVETVVAGEPAGKEAGAEGAAEETPDKLMLSVYEFEPWQVLPMHRNLGSDTVLYVARGQGIMFLNDEERSVDADSAIYVPANATYGMLAADMDMAVISMQCPTPVETEYDEKLGYNCPVCYLGTPVTMSTYDGCITVCPRCNVKLKLKRGPEGFKAEETSEPAPTEAETI